MSADARRLRGALGTWSARVHDLALTDTADSVRDVAPLGKVTPTSRPPGTLRRSIKAEPSLSLGGVRFSGKVVAPVIQARTTDKGSPPHIIRARRAPFLRFWWDKGPSGPGIYYFRKVNHPGNEPQNWWEPALRAAYPDALRRAARRIRF